jgi:hypothetical protein
MKHGPIRSVIEDMKKLAQASGLTIEQVADVYDTVAAVHKVGDVVASTSDDRLKAPEPKGVQ